MGKRNNNEYEYESIYEPDFAIELDYENGTLSKNKDLLIFHEPGKTNKTENTPDDILQIAVKCNLCGSFMDFEEGDGWCNGKYVCPICGETVSEEDSINSVMNNSVSIDNDYEDYWK